MNYFPHYRLTGKYEPLVHLQLTGLHARCGQYIDRGQVRDNTNLVPTCLRCIGIPWER